MNLLFFYHSDKQSSFSRKNRLNCQDSWNVSHFSLFREQSNPMKFRSILSTLTGKSPCSIIELDRVSNKECPSCQGGLSISLYLNIIGDKEWGIKNGGECHEFNKISRVKPLRSLNPLFGDKRLERRNPHYKQLTICVSRHVSEHEVTQGEKRTHNTNPLGHDAKNSGHSEALLSDLQSISFMPLIYLVL